MDEPHLEIQDATLKMYTYDLLSEARTNPNIIIEYSNLLDTDGVLGKTFYGSVNIIKLDISLKAMDYDPWFVKYVLYHELGHAVFNRVHCDCFSLMNPNKYVSEFRQDSVKRQMLIQELIK